MASFDLATGYVGDWAVHDFVESAEYQPPPGVGVGSPTGGLKAKVSDLGAGGLQGAGSQLIDTTDAVSVLLWAPAANDTTIRPMGRLVLAESGVFIVQTASRSRFGHWELTATRENVDDLRDA